MSLGKIFAISGMALLVGCADIASEDIATSGICATMSATENNGNTDVKVVLTAGCGLGASYVALGAGDTLTASIDGGPSQTLTKSEFLGAINYKTTLSGATPGANVAVALTRADHVDALSSVAMPADIIINGDATLTGPTPTYDSTGTITATWSKVGTESEKVNANLTISCTNHLGSIEVNHTNLFEGNYSSGTISKVLTNVFSSISYPNVNSCSPNSGTLTVSSIAYGNADSALDPASKIRGMMNDQVSGITINFP